MAKHADHKATTEDLHKARTTVVRMMTNPGLNDDQYEKLVGQLEELDEEIREES
jgi:Spy/CpxP family protein refolding chaperone